jgi:L-rhamnose mutarotase
MIRRAFTMKLKPGGLAEYKRHLDAIWPDLVAEIERQGIAQITIFENDPVLFLYSEIHDQDAWDRLWHTQIHDRWGEIMNPLMVFNDEGIVDSAEVREVFHLETSAGKAAAETGKAAAEAGKAAGAGGGSDG